MPMKRLWSYAFVALVAVCCLSCSDEEVLPNQRDKIVSFLTSSHAPALVAESDADQEAQQAFYTVSGNTVYRYIDNYYAPGRDQKRVVEASSQVTITFRAYVFTFSTITDSTFPCYSNAPLLRSAYL